MLIWGVRAREFPRPLSGCAARAGRGEEKGLATAPRAVDEPPKVISLMEALKRSLVQEEKEPSSKKAPSARPPREPSLSDRRQRALLLPVSGGREKNDAAVAEPAPSTAPKRRRKPEKSAAPPRFALQAILASLRSPYANNGRCRPEPPSKMDVMTVSPRGVAPPLCFALCSEGHGGFPRNARSLGLFLTLESSLENRRSLVARSPAPILPGRSEA